MNHIVTPFVFLIDSAEQQPFSFTGIAVDGDPQSRSWTPRTRWQSLGRYPCSYGDYGLDGFFKRCHVERKSLSDCQSTILGFDGRRERFESELQNLSEIEAGLVVVEASYLDVLQQAYATPNKTAQQNARTLQRSILAYQRDFKVRWLFAGSRRQAEISTFRFFELFWKKHKGELEEKREKVVVAPGSDAVTEMQKEMEEIPF